VPAALARPGGIRLATGGFDRNVVDHRLSMTHEQLCELWDYLVSEDEAEQIGNLRDQGILVPTQQRGPDCRLRLVAALVAPTHSDDGPSLISDRHLVVPTGLPLQATAAVTAPGSSAPALKALAGTSTILPPAGKLPPRSAGAAFSRSRSHAGRIVG
jgi:hypothetical protein